MHKTFKSKDGKRIATVHPHPFLETGWTVTYTFPSGTQAMKAPFPSKRSAAEWAKGYVNDPANA